jgi:putative ABC transport system substrate-binding protein
MAAVADPVGQHLIASLARPGANITGLSSQAEDIMPKMLELFASVLPRPVIVAVLTDAASAVHPRMWQALDPVAQTLKVKLVKVDVGRPADVQLPTAFETAVREKAGAIFVLPDEPLFLSRRADIVALAAKHRLPAFYGAREFVDDGGLMSYGESLRIAYRNAASYIKKVAHGAAPADIPVAQPTRFELVINMKTAKALGITVPQPVLLSPTRDRVGPAAIETRTSGSLAVLSLITQFARIGPAVDDETSRPAIGSPKSRAHRLDRRLSVSRRLNGSATRAPKFPDATRSIDT